MDPFTISAGLVAVLAPLLPALGRLGGAAADRVAQRVGEAVGDTAVRGAAALWRRLGPALAQRPDAAEAITTLSADPADVRALRVLQGRLAMLLDADPDLLRAGADVVAAHERHVVSTVHGDGNVVQQGDGNITISGSSGVVIRRGGRGPGR